MFLEFYVQNSILIKEWAMPVNRKAGKNLCKEQDGFGHIIEGKNEER